MMYFPHRPVTRPSPAPAANLVGYRLTGWPLLPDTERTAPVLRALSIMTTRVVTSRWLSLRTGWSLERANAFMRRLEDQDCARTLSCEADEELPPAARRSD